MNRSIAKQANVVIASALSLACPTWAQPSAVVCDSSGDGPQICVRFDNLEDSPVENQDFEFNFSTPNADNPSVILLRGDDGLGTLFHWRVWSWTSAADKTPRNIGSVTSPAAFDFDVKLLNEDGDPGAANVGTITLDPTSAAKFSRISGGRITGSLTDGLELQQSSGDQGGGVQLQIDGTLNVEGVGGLVPHMRTGDVLTIGTLNGQLGFATVDDGATVSIGTLTGATPGINLDFDNMHGRLNLLNGIPQSRYVTIQNLFDGEIDFYDQVVAGLYVGGGDGTILRGGTILPPVGFNPHGASVVLGANSAGGPFTGCATFAGIAGGNITTEAGADFDGALYILGDAWGSPLIEVEGEVTGSIDIGGDVGILEGDSVPTLIDIDGALSGTLEIGSSGTTVGGDVGELADLEIGGASSGSIHLYGDLEGDLAVAAGASGPVDVGEDVTATGSIDIDGSASGAITILGGHDGLLSVGGSVGAAIEIGQKGSSGIIDLTGPCEGSLTIVGPTTLSSEIQLRGGLDAGQQLTINQAALNFNAGGLIEVGTSTNPVGLQGRILVKKWPAGGPGNLTGPLKIWGNQSAGAKINIAGNVEYLSPGIEITGNCAGDVTFADLIGNLSIGGNTAATAWISGLNLNDGDILIGGNSAGDVYVKHTANSNSQIDIDGKLLSSGSVKVDELFSGDVLVAEETDRGSLLDFAGGLDSGTDVEINGSLGDYHAHGTIRVGPPTGTPPLQPVVFDGSIRVNGAGGTGGDLTGTISVVGCHATSAPLDLCVCGDNDGTVTVTQTGCAPQVTVSCQSGCLGE